jgi:Raf kinase inhibitor-like YbhB/YbcL family protein
MSYAIVVRDIDAGNLVHWVLYDIPATILEVAEDVPAGYMPTFPAGAKQAELQGSGYYGYFGPCSPRSINTYQWTVHALDTTTLPGVTMTSTENEIANAVEAASIASASVSGES